MVHFAPSMLLPFLDALDGPLPTLDTCILIGEAVTPLHVRRFVAALPGAELHNLYGPTEAAIEVTAWRAAASTGAVSWANS